MTDAYRLNPKITEWTDMFMSWGIPHTESVDLVLDMWLKLPLDIRLSNPEDDDLK